MNSIKFLFLALFLSIGIAANAYDLNSQNSKPQETHFLNSLENYKKAALNGDGMAAYKVGFTYNEGLYITQDYAEARKWFRLAVMNGAKDGAIDIGLQYFYAKGVPHDYVKANMWYSIAAMNIDHAKTLRDNIETIMTPVQIAKSQKLARDCIDRKFKNCD